MLGGAVFRAPSPVTIEQGAVDDFLRDCVVVLPAGGEGSRIRSVSAEHGLHKTSIPLPGNDTMMERTIRLYMRSGLGRFLVLLYHHGESITKVLGDGSERGIDVRYSWDPGRPVGRGGAILHALNSGKISERDNMIVHNPDDQILGYVGDFARTIVKGHLVGRDRGAIATAVVVRGTHYEFSGMKVDGGMVSELESYPFIPIPTHIGVTVFSPEAYPYFRRTFDLSRKTDFEGILFPKLVRQNKLWSVEIPTGSWLSVNTPKALKKLVDFLGNK